MTFVPLTIRKDTTVLYLNHGHRTLIDTQDWPILSRHCWRSTTDKDRRYAVTLIRGKEIKMHQLICPTSRGYVPDHINRNGLDNRSANLRPATFQQNCANSKKRKSKTGLRGAYWDKSKECFVSKIACDGKKLRHLGHFKTAEEAARAYDAAARERYGAFAVTNFEQPQAEGTEA